MRIAQEELFAPIFLIMPFPGTDWRAAVEIANSTRYGLGASVFGGRRAVCEKVAAQLECGMVNINDFAVSYLNQGLPFGGAKKSGYGRFGGPEGLLGLTRPKAVTRDTLFSWVRTGIPKPLDYPLKNSKKSWGCECAAEGLDAVWALADAHATLRLQSFEACSSLRTANWSSR